MLHLYVLIFTPAIHSFWHVYKYSSIPLWSSGSGNRTCKICFQTTRELLFVFNVMYSFQLTHVQEVMWWWMKVVYHVYQSGLKRLWVFITICRHLLQFRGIREVLFWKWRAKTTQSIYTLINTAQGWHVLKNTLGNTTSWWLRKKHYIASIIIRGHGKVEIRLACHSGRFGHIIKP